MKVKFVSIVNTKRDENTKKKNKKDALCII